MNFGGGGAASLRMPHFGVRGLGPLPVFALDASVMRQRFVRRDPSRFSLASYLPRYQLGRLDLTKLDPAPDLAENMFSRRWWRGVATLALLCGSAVALAPGFAPLQSLTDAAMPASDWKEAQAQVIAPIALGADTGSQMNSTAQVRPLANAPERPELMLTATLGQGDSLVRLLSRSGVGAEDARAAMSAIAGVISPADIRPGTRIAMRLGKRTDMEAARPLEHIAFRARFDLKLELARINGMLQLKQLPVAVDSTPLRIRGTIGTMGLYRAARAAGAPAEAVQEYLRVISTQSDIGADYFPSDQFDLILDYRRAATGEVAVGDLLYAGLQRNGRSDLQIMRWRKDGQPVWYDAAGVGKTQGGLSVPIPGARVSSNYGWRMHPILRFLKLHTGTDYAAPSGTPVHAVADGTISYAARKGGYGNFIQLEIGGGLASGYGHLSAFAVSPGQRVSRGQVIGYVGSTGMSTGPHLHYEMYRNGARIDPRSVSYVEQAALSGQNLAAFRQRLAELMAVPGGGAR